MDQYCKFESDPSPFLPQNQQLLRGADHTSLGEEHGDVEQVGNEAVAIRAGRLFALSSSHVGSDQYMGHKM